VETWFAPFHLIDSERVLKCYSW